MAVFKSSRLEVFKVILKISKKPHENSFKGFTGLKPATLLKKTSRVFSCEFCKIFKGICFYRTTPVALSIF